VKRTNIQTEKEAEKWEATERREAAEEEGGGEAGERRGKSELCIDRLSTGKQNQQQFDIHRKERGD
jgi:hypothetical protein